MRSIITLDTTHTQCYIACDLSVYLDLRHLLCLIARLVMTTSVQDPRGGNDGGGGSSNRRTKRRRAITASKAAAALTGCAVMFLTYLQAMRATAYLGYCSYGDDAGCVEGIAGSSSRGTDSARQQQRIASAKSALSSQSRMPPPQLLARDKLQRDQLTTNSAGVAGGHELRSEITRASGGGGDVVVPTKAFRRWEDVDVSVTVTRDDATTTKKRVKDGWCAPGGIRKGANRVGIFFVKTHKCASTTGSSVTLRIARNVGRRMFGGDANNANRGRDALENSTAFALEPDQAKLLYPRYREEMATMCVVRPHHNEAWKFSWDPARSFKWTWVRDPTKRIVSHYYWSRGGRFEDFARGALGNAFGEGYMSRYLRPDRPRSTYETARDADRRHVPDIRKDHHNAAIIDRNENHRDVVRSILDAFDFIGGKRARAFL